MSETAAAPGDSAFGASAFERRLAQRPPTRWMGWRLRLLVLAALLGCLGSFSLMRWLADSRYLDASFETGPGQTLVLTASRQPALKPYAGRTVLALRAQDGQRLALDSLALQRSARWQLDDARRAAQVHEQEQIARALAGGDVTLEFADGSTARVAAPVRNYAGLGVVFWFVAAFALLLYLIGTVAALVRPQPRNLLYLVMAYCQAGTLLFIGIDSLRGLGLPAGAAANELLPRLALDLFTTAAGVHAFALHPRRVPGAAVVAGGAWAVAALVLLLAGAGLLPALWWWAQGTLLALGVLALCVISWSYRIEANPFAAVMRRIGVIAVGTLALVSAAVAAAAGQIGVPGTVSTLGPMIWYLFFASLLLLAPFLWQSKQLLREFALLAGISTVATSLDLLFVAVFSIGQFTSLTLAVFLALGAYAGARQWLLNQISGSSVLTTERTFEQLYRVAHEVQEQPARHATLLAQVLRDLFEPLEVLRVERAATSTQVVGGGSALVVPVRRGSDDAARAPLSLVLRFARRGKRLFSHEDARLADRVVEHLRRAVAYDRAVERGRSEERLRIAQDLHDDIGARLLTLMYKAQSPEMEDYVRHTLLDLKTLTRGLAASEHRLSHACAEWKTDLTQRLTAAHVQLGWQADYDRDVRLSVVQWSALTRVLRELISNALYHAQATRVDVNFSLAGSLLTLSVADDGSGAAPQDWAHGLGLGGVRKRVKLLGGEVSWRENRPRGIVCELRVPAFIAKV